MSARGKAILDWALVIFGPLAAGLDERAMRFVEEAVELGHAEGVSLKVALAIVERVYDQPRGDLRRELGQAGMMLLALAERRGLDLDGEIDSEFERVRAIPKAEFEARYAKKVRLGIAKDNEGRKRR